MKHEHTRHTTTWNSLLTGFLTLCFVIFTQATQANTPTPSQQPWKVHQTQVWEDAGQAVAFLPAARNTAEHCRNSLASSTNQGAWDCPPDSAHWATGWYYPFAMLNQSLGALQRMDNSGGGERRFGICLTCDFFATFLMSISYFSGAVYIYFLSFFGMLAPVFVIIWMTWKTMMLFFAGGEGGGRFVTDFAKKIALFGFIWIVMVAPSPGAENLPRLWVAAGPQFANYGLRVSEDLRNQVLNAVNATAGGVRAGGAPRNPAADFQAIQCEGIENRIPYIEQGNPVSGYGIRGAQLACAIERTHVMGIASGLVVTVIGADQLINGFISAVTPWNWGSTRASNGLMMVVQGLIMIILGLFMVIIFAKSLIWFVFLILDSLVKIMITAALMPVFVTMFLFQITKEYAVNAFRALMAALVSLISIGLISALAFFLISNTAVVYQTTWQAVDPLYPIDMRPLQNTGLAAQFSEFVFRLAVSPVQTNPHRGFYIPFDFATPWTIYMILVSLAIVSLGKKIIAIIENIFQVTGGSAMADAALTIGSQSANAAFKVGVAGAVVGGVATKWGVGGGWAGLKALDTATGGQGRNFLFDDRSGIGVGASPSPFAKSNMPNVAPAGAAMGVAAMTNVAGQSAAIVSLQNQITQMQEAQRLRDEADKMAKEKAAREERKKKRLSTLKNDVTRGTQLYKTVSGSTQLDEKPESMGKGE